MDCGFLKVTTKLHIDIGLYHELRIIDNSFSTDTSLNDILWMYGICLKKYYDRYCYVKLTLFSLETQIYGRFKVEDYIYSAIRKDIDTYLCKTLSEFGLKDNQTLHFIIDILDDET